MNEKFAQIPCGVVSRKSAAGKNLTLLDLVLCQYIMTLSFFSGTHTLEIFQNSACFYYRIRYIFKPKLGEQNQNHNFYRQLYPHILKDIEVNFAREI